MGYLEMNESRPTYLQCMDLLNRLGELAESLSRRIEKLESGNPGKVDLQFYKLLTEKIDKLENKISQLEVFKVKEHNECGKAILSFDERINNLEDIVDSRLIKLEEHHARQIDENRKSFDHILQLEDQIKGLLGRQDFHAALTNAAICASTKPHKCPVCDGKYIALFKECESECLACDKGIVSLSIIRKRGKSVI